jgi:hypothetical protein
VEQALGHELADLATRHEGRVETHHGRGPEAPAPVLGVNVVPEVAGLDADEGTGEPLVFSD